MKIAAARAFYFDYAEKFNDRLRTLAMAGIGIIWVFNQSNQTGPWIPRELLAPGILLVAALALDVLQHAYGMLAWRLVASKGEGYAPEREIETPKWLDWPTMSMFYARTLLVFAAYIYLLLYLRSRFS